MAKRAFWTTEARADIRSIDRETALRLLKSLSRYLLTESGDVKHLKGFDPPLQRLRIGDWRLVFRIVDQESIEIVRVQNRREAYR
jgi:mRNA-degrading endonuclease RelE of RelBE toxin-antitoxin system